MTMDNSKLKAGYKNTEVGVIPEDWEVKTLNNLSEKIMVGIASAATHAYRDKGIILFRNQNIKSNYLDDSDILHITSEYEKFFKGKRLKSGDLLTARTGYPGTTCIIPDKYEGTQSFTTLITRLKKGNLNPYFVCFYMNSEQGELFFTLNQIGGGQKNVNAGTLKSMLIPLPLLPEQTAIATVLSDTDSLIQSLEKKIAKKQLIKKGAMQELLSSTSSDTVKPKEGWVVKTLGEVLKVRHGKDQKQIEDINGKYPILGTGGLMGFTNEFLYDKPSVLIGRKGTIDKPQYMDTPFWTVDTLFYTEIFKENSVKFIFYVFKLIDWYSFNEASGVPSLNAKTIEKINKGFPSFKEQNQIAQILSDMDNEIETLAKKLAKYKQLKQGLMQNLLTGKIRLV